MKLKYYIYMSVFVYCGCSDAAPKEQLQELTCPYVFPAEKDFLNGWVALGKLPSEKIQLRQIGIIEGNAAEEKQRLAGAKERIFAENIIDEWEEFDGRSEAVAEYSEQHDDTALKCVYAKSLKESFDVDSNVVLLIPLPPKKHITCLLVQRNIDPTNEISCKVK